MLLISDLHFTDKPEDAYRWRIFDWVLEQYTQLEDKNLLILGDLTDSKDHHSAKLVNMVVENLHRLQCAGMEIFILKGNHDYIDPDMPYFGFLKRMEWVHYIAQPAALAIEGRVCLFLPHSRDPITEWEGSKIVGKSAEADLVFMHQSVVGSVMANGYLMDKGLPLEYLRRFSGDIYSGDIHTPQICGGVVTYVGTPYSIRFNDEYEGRALHIHGRSVQSLSPNIMRRWTLDIDSVGDIAKNDGVHAGDQVKIRYHGEHSSETTKQLQEVCAKRQLELFGVSYVSEARLPIRGRKRRELQEHRKLLPGEIVDRFATVKGLPKRQRRAGRKIVGG